MQDLSAAKLLQIHDCQFLELSAWIHYIFTRFNGTCVLGFGAV